MRCRISLAVFIIVSWMKAAARVRTTQRDHLATFSFDTPARWRESLTFVGACCLGIFVDELSGLARREDDHDPALRVLAQSSGRHPFVTDKAPGGRARHRRVASMSSECKGVELKKTYYGVRWQR